MSSALRIALLAVSLASVSLAQSVTLTNDSTWRDYPEYVVGDPFTLTVTGAPNKAVTMDAVRQGTPYHWELGTTNSNGILIVYDVMGSWNVGDWTEVVYVDGHEASPELEFSVEEPESCTFFPYGTGNLSPWYVDEDTYPDAYEPPDFDSFPQDETHENLSGPCGAVSAYSNTWYVDAEYEFDDYDYPEGGYKKVEWILELSDRTGWGRCNPLNNLNYFESCLNAYPYYEYGSIHSIFQHRDTSDQIWRTSYFTLTIDHACADLLGDLYCSYP